MWQRRHRCGKRGRCPKPVMLDSFPTIQDFIPAPLVNSEPVFLDLAEFEVLRLIELEDLSQEEAGKRMGVSRGTVWRLLKSGRKKLVKALVEGRPIKIVHWSLENSEEKS
ncbi:MAG: DUF134 domain-containing protein [Archaeoglobales archaeon]|nr:DUF134 domain-containing protein [Archaeoglobales archaeon]